MLNLRRYDRDVRHLHDHKGLGPYIHRWKDGKRVADCPATRAQLNYLAKLKTSSRIRKNDGEQPTEENSRTTRNFFYADIGEAHLGGNFKINGKEFWISGIWRPYCPEGLRGNADFFYKTTGHEDDPDPKLIRVFKDKFDMFENFVVDGKNLRQWIETGEVDFIDYNE